jgi:hypothetical protein
MAGRAVEVAPAEPGSPGWTDGTTVYLDPEFGRPDLLRTLAVQTSMLAEGSLDPGILGRLRGRRAVANRYLAVEGHRALAANEDFLPPLVQRSTDLAVALLADSPEDSLGIALGRDPVPDPPHWFGTLRVRATIDAQESSASPSPAQQAADPGSPPDLRDIDEEESDDADDAGYLGQLVSSPVGGGGPIGRLLKKLLSSTRSRGEGGPPGADAATHIRRTSTGKSVRSVSLHAGTPPPDDASAVDRSASTYPEWNVHKNQYREDWCTVHESDPPSDGGGPIPVPDAARFRRSLARLGAGLVPCRRRPQGDEIDIDAAVEARVETLAGSAPDESVYIESLRQRRDLSVLVLLDISGSAGEPASGGRTVHELQRDVAASLVTALAELGDRVALYAFNSQGRSSVRLTRVKAFEDPHDGRMLRRIGALVPVAYTRMGAAIRHATTIVENRGGTPHRLLVVISDGFAYDHGYEGKYGEADARRALLEARRAGVGCLCLSVGAGTSAGTLRRVFGTAAHASVATQDQLVPLIGPLFRTALRSAESRRRVFQRRERTRERLELERSHS